ncbi:hypothetical protein RUM44_010819 [Polyplax serrata]|uniref:Replication termination factor 2 n=1 Tax=Polyplax serrata TaxID=468196 RepID=A0ABR1AN93_POLSC
MGCDGGTIPRRDELVRTKKKPEQKDKQSELSFKWGHCSLTQEPLQTPIVACQLGKLYSKVAVLEALLDKNLPDSHKHIKSIKDVKELNLTDNPAYRDKDTKGDGYNDLVSPYICPVIGLEMNGKYKFVYFWSCGCVVSERALKAVKTKVCHKCQKQFTDKDVIILNGTDEDLELMSTNMKERQLKQKADKKQKKMAEADEKNKVIVSVNGGEATTSGNCSEKQPKPVPKPNKKRPNGIAIEDPDFKKTKLNYNVSKDPKATEVFKSLFTSHKSAEKQVKAHWITYNPFYN